MTYNVDFNISGLLFLVVYYIFVLRQYDTSTATSKCFRWMAISVIAANALDTLTAVTISYSNVVPVWINYFLNIIYFFFAAMTAVMLPAYIRYNIDPAGKRTLLDRINAAFIVVYLCMVVSTPFTHLIIYFDENRQYSRGPLYLVMMFVPVVEEIISLTRLIVNRRKFSRKQLICLLAFVVITVTGFLIQLYLQIISGIQILLVYYAVSVALVILLCAYETPDYRKLMQTTKELTRSKEQLEKARRAAEEANKVVHELTKSAMWNIYLNEQGEYVDVTTSPEFRLMLDSKKDPNIPDFEIWLNGVHPDDRERVFAAFNAAAHGRGVYNEELRFYDATCSYRWYRGSGELTHDEEGNPVFSGIIQSIQDEKLKESLTNEKLAALEKLERSQIALKSALEEAQSASRAKGEFLSNMSHDIRTPMNAVIGFTELALEHYDEPEAVKDYLERIRSSGDHLLMLINDILDMSKIESGRIHIEPARCDLSEIVENIEKMVDADIRSHKLHFSVIQENMKDSIVMCDKLRLNQILLNCIGNSIKFTPEDGYVEFKVQKLSPIDETFSEYSFIIADTGIGMSKEFLSHMFEPFERERNSTISKTQGSGLGMTITKNLVEMMGGTINVESREGEGTTYIINVPFEVLHDTGRSESMTGRPYENVTTEEMEEYIRGRHFLLVDDNATNRTLAKGVLKSKGITVDEAENGEIAVQMVENSAFGEYDLILMDVQMPVMGGYEAADRIRALEDPELAGLPILAMTANAFEEDREECLRHGMNDHIAKPYKADQLVRKLYYCLRNCSSHPDMQS